MKLGKESFRGKSFHTAQWPKDYQVEGHNVAIIGTGASAIQTIPAIADKAKKLTVFQRTPGWVPHLANFVFPSWLKVCKKYLKTCSPYRCLLCYSGSLPFFHQ
jgi:cation diffusion facilitator CzcD-associated flavoprotein CzcO